jgi:hypothetical protein
MASGISGHLEADDYDSMYESRSDLTTVQKQHFVEWFSGSALDSIWTERDLVGTGTFAMDDSVDGGYKISAGSGGTDQQQIDFNGIRHYEEQGCVMIAVSKHSSTSSNSHRGV